MLSVYMENLLITIGVFIILGWAFYLPLRGGQIYNGPIFCMAIGGYFAAYTSLDLDWPLAAAFVGGILAAAFVGYALSFILAGISGLAMAVATIALIFIVQTIARNLEFLGKSTGLPGIPTLPHILPVTLGFILVLAFLLYRFSNSRWGRAVEAVLVDREAAEVMGIDVKKMSMTLQTISAGMGGLAGVIYVFNLGTVVPSTFSFNLLLYAFTVLFVGGRTTPWGVPVLAPVLWLIPELAPPIVGEWRNVIFAAIIIAMLVIRPYGMITRGTVSAVERALRLKTASS